MRLAVVALCLAATAANANADFFKEAVPGAVAPPTAPSLTVVDGVKVTMVTVVSKKTPDELKAHYGALFQRAGLYIADEVKDIELAAAKQVTAIDPDRMISYTALFQAGGKGTTTVILSAAELARPPTPVVSSFAPMMPGAQNVSSAQLEWMETLSYMAPATPFEIKAFYREELKKMGYAEAEELSFVKDGHRIALTVTPGLQLRGVLLVHERPGPGEVVTPPEQKAQPRAKTGSKDAGR